MTPIDQLSPDELRSILFYTDSHGNNYPVSQITINPDGTVTIGSNQFQAGAKVLADIQSKIETYEAYKLIFAQSTITDKAAQISEDIITNKCEAQFEHYDEQLHKFLATFTAKVNAAFSDCNENFQAIVTKIQDLESSISKFKSFADSTDLSSIKSTIKSNLDELAPTKATLADITSTLQKLFNESIVKH